MVTWPYSGSTKVNGKLQSVCYICGTHMYKTGSKKHLLICIHVDLYHGHMDMASNYSHTTVEGSTLCNQQDNYIQKEEQVQYLLEACLLLAHGKFLWRCQNHQRINHRETLIKHVSEHPHLNSHTNWKKIGIWQKYLNLST